MYNNHIYFDFAAYAMTSILDWNHFALVTGTKLSSRSQVGLFPTLVSTSFSTWGMKHEALRLNNLDVKLTNVPHLFEVKVGSMGYDFYDGQFVSASACDAMPDEIALDTFEGFLAKPWVCIFWAHTPTPGRLLVDLTILTNGYLRYLAIDT